MDPSPPAPSSAKAETVDWERIPLDRRFGESLGDFATRKAFSKRMGQPQTLPACIESWKAPPGLRHVEMTFELRVRSEDDALVVEDAVVTGGNVSDASLERCATAQLRGRRVSTPGIQPGLAFRIEWGGIQPLH